MSHGAPIVAEDLRPSAKALEHAAKVASLCADVSKENSAKTARRILHRLKQKGALCFMSSHRASIAGNVEGGLELYRASKSAHPGWPATAMGTLDGAVVAEIDIETSVRGVADVVERYMRCGKPRKNLSFYNESLEKDKTSPK